MAEPLIKTQDMPKSTNPFAQQNSLAIIKKNAAMEEQQYRLQQQALRDQESQLINQMAADKGIYGTINGRVNSPLNAQLDAIRSQSAQLDAKISAAQQKQQGTNPDGTPIAPEWVSLMNEDTGTLLDQYKISELDPTQWEAYQRMRQEGLRGPDQQSAWAKIQTQRQAAEEAAARDAAAKQALSGTAQAQSQLAMRGGLGSGAQTSLARDMQRNLLSQRQGVQRQGIGARLDIAKQDEEARQRSLGALTGYEMDIGKANKQVQQYNLNNLLKEAEGRRAWEQQQYSEKMKAWAAEKEAQASSGGGGGGGK